MSLKTIGNAILSFFGFGKTEPAPTTTVSVGPTGPVGQPGSTETKGVAGPKDSTPATTVVVEPVRAEPKSSVSLKDKPVKATTKPVKVPAPAATSATSSTVTPAPRKRSRNRNKKKVENNRHSETDSLPLTSEPVSIPNQSIWDAPLTRAPEPVEVEVRANPYPSRPVPEVDTDSSFNRRVDDSPSHSSSYSSSSSSDYSSSSSSSSSSDSSSSSCSSSCD